MSNFLYVIRCNDSMYKIGVASDVVRRLAELQTGNPYTLFVQMCFEFVAASPVEQVLHQKFESKRILNEWFSLSEDDLGTIQQICLLLDGKIDDEPDVASDEDVEEAEDVSAQSEIRPIMTKDEMNGLISDGWRIETKSFNNKGGSQREYYYLRKNENIDGTIKHHSKYIGRFLPT